MSSSIVRCGSCRKLRVQACAERPFADQCCREFESFDDWLVKEIGSVERHLRYTTALAGFLVGVVSVSIVWVLMAG